LRLTHFEALRPICPVCKNRGLSEDFSLEIGSVSHELASQIIEGVLLCTNPNCQSEFPIVDGVPIILPRLRAYVADHIFHVFARNDLSSVTESIFGDCCSQGSALDSMRQHLSCYVWGHYADLDPEESPDSLKKGSVLRILEQGMELESSHGSVGSTDQGPTVDIGCGPGRTTIAIAQKTDQLALGIDLNFSMLRLASNVLRTGHVSYPRRRVGLVYDRREFDVQFSHLELVDFWACDALALPFSDRSFARATGMNVLDSVSDPQSLLSSIARILQPNGSAILACPYDWTASVTPVESWIGGHSQRNELSGESAPLLRRLLTDSNATANESAPVLQFASELDDVPWTVRMHDRSSMQYRVHLVHARRQSMQAESE
jgi:ubiquinone/menaquinone biosynthesis C-methylase UbiE/uncharacterized protein YbaR (Trm112 family)